MKAFEVTTGDYTFLVSAGSPDAAKEVMTDNFNDEFENLMIKEIPKRKHSTYMVNDEDGVKEKIALSELVTDSPRIIACPVDL